MSRANSDLVRRLEEVSKLKSPISLADLGQICSSHGITGHIAVLTEPYLTRIIQGEKTVESRFSKVRLPPYKLVGVGDVIFLKEVSGPIKAIAAVVHADFFGPLQRGEARTIMRRHADALALDAEFVERKCNSPYATLIQVGTITATLPIWISKSDRRGWVVIANRMLGQLEHRL